MGLGVLRAAPPMRGGVGEGTPSPRAQQGRPNGWSVSTIREVLKRPLYRGEIVYGKTRSAYGRELGKLTPGKGRVREKAQIPVPEETWPRLPVNESLRIVDDAHAALAELLDDLVVRYGPTDHDRRILALSARSKGCQPVL